MMALHDELVQRMKTVADTDSASSDDDNALSIVVFEPSSNDPDVGRVELQRVDPDRLPKPRQPAAEKTPAVATPPPGDGRPPVARGNGVGPAAAGRPTSSQGPVARRPAQLVLSINKYGEKPGELKDPLGVACLPSGEIVVSEWGNRRLQLFDVNGTSIRLIAPGQVLLYCLSQVYVGR